MAYSISSGRSNGIGNVTGQILVPLRRDDRIEDVVPYLEQIARPSCKVILLIHYSVDRLDWFQNRPTTPVMKEQKFVAEKEAFFGLDALRERGVTVALDIYAGPLKKVVKQYTLRGDIDLLMIPAGRRIGRLLQNYFFFLNFSSLGKSSSVLLLRPDISKREQ